MSVQCVRNRSGWSWYCRLCSRCVWHSVCHRASKCAGPSQQWMKCQLCAIHTAIARTRPSRHQSGVGHTRSIEVRTFASKNSRCGSVHPGRLYEHPKRRKSTGHPALSCYQTKLALNRSSETFTIMQCFTSSAIGADPNRHSPVRTLTVPASLSRPPTPAFSELKEEMVCCGFFFFFLRHLCNCASRNLAGSFSFGSSRCTRSP